MKRLLVHLVAALVALSIFVPAKEASADLFSVWARGDTLVLKGDDNIPWFANNKGYPSFGFGVGGEVLFFDAFLDANFFTDGSQWNQLGLGFDIDVIPIELITLAPTAQVMYFFAKHGDGVDLSADKGLHARVGAQFGINFLKFLSFNLEGFAGYVLAFPEIETGISYSGGANLMFKFGF